MAIAAAAVAAVFAAVGSGIAAAGTAVATAVLSAGAFVGIDTAAAAFAIQSFGFALAGASGLAAGFSAWTTVIAVGSSFAALALSQPKPASSGQQINTKLDPQAPYPVAFGRIGTGGYIFYRASHGSNNRYYNQATALSLGPITEIESWRLNNLTTILDGDPLTSGMKTVTALANSTIDGSSTKLFLNGQTTTCWKLGNIPESSFSTQSGISGLKNLTAASGVSGLASTFIELDYDTTAFPTGQPAMQWTIKGRPAYDPRQDTTYPGGFGSHRVSDPSTWTYTENPFIAALAWIIGLRQNGVKMFGLCAPISLVDVAAFVDGANHADSLGWKIGCIVLTSDDKTAVLNSLLQAGSGVMIQPNALLGCMFDAPRVAIDTITPDDVIGGLTITNTLAYRDRKNTIEASYLEEGQFWNLTPSVEVSSDTYLDLDGGEQKTLEVTYGCVTNAVQCAQLAGYSLANLREGLQITMRCRMRLINRYEGHIVTVDIPTIGPPFNMKVIGRQYDTASTEVMLTLVSETAGKDDFALGLTAEAPTPLSIPLYDPSNPDAPGSSAWSITSVATVANGVSIPCITISGAVDDPLATSVVAEIRLFGTTAWTVAAQLPASTTQFVLTNVLANTEYEVAISYVTYLGVTGSRLILNPVTTGDGVGGTVATSVAANSIVWGSNAISDVPVGLTTNTDGFVEADHVAYSNTSTVANVIATQQTQLDVANATIQAQANTIAGLTNRLNFSLESALF